MVLLLENGVDLGLPDVLAEVRCDGIHDSEERLHKSRDNVWVSLAAHSNLIALLDAQHVIEQHNDLLVLHVVVVGLGLIDALVDLIDHQFVPKTMARCIVLTVVDRLLLKIVVDPLLEIKQL